MASHTDSNPSHSTPSAAQMRAIDKLCDQFEQAWQDGTPDLSVFLAEAPEGCQKILLGELVAIELTYRKDAEGNAITDTLLHELHPSLATQLHDILDGNGDSSSAYLDDAETIRPDPPSEAMSDVVLVSDRNSHGLHIRCPHCREPVELLADTPCDEVSCKTCGSEFSLVGRDEEAADAPTLRAIGRFELVSRLGVGGFGTVWKARDTELDRIVALKIPRRGNLGPKEIEHFFREARAAAQLRHPNIVAVHEIGREEETVFIVSDYVRGVTLSDWMSGFRPSVKEIARLAAIVADALEHAHSLGVIHRDLKPSNIMIDDLGQPHIMDFGLAKRVTGEVTMTVDGQILGTAAYMSPEQAAGDARWTDRRTDIYSLGVVLFQLATGEFPYRGNHEMHLYRKQIEDAPDPRKLNPHVPQDFATICLKCLERDPNRRYAHASDVAAELRRMLRGEPILARPISRTARVWRWAQRKPALAAALLLTLLLAVGGPLVAATIAQKNWELDRQNRELYLNIGKDKVADEAREEELLRLQNFNRLLVGDAPELEPVVESWQKQVIKEVVDTRIADTDGATSAERSTPLEELKLRLARGFLNAELGRNETALEHLQVAESSLRALLKLRPNDAVLQAALAECLAVVTKTATDEVTVQQAQSELLKLRRNIVESRGTEVPALIDLMVAQGEASARAVGKGNPIEHLEALAESDQDELQRQLLANWPSDPAEVYEAACRLTMRPAILSEAADVSGAADILDDQ